MIIVTNDGSSGKLIKTDNKHVYPEDFFNIEHPGNPVVYVQFKTNAMREGGDITNSDLWESITFNPNNFFDSMELTDDGMAKKISLSLRDLNHTFLETKIMEMIHAMNQELDSNKKKLKETTVTSVDKKTMMIKSFSSSSISLRVRFGYNTSSTRGAVIQAPDSEGFENRLSSSNRKNPTIKSPWLYFVLTGMEMSVTHNGLEVRMEGVSEPYIILNSLKLVNVGYQIRGEAEEVIEILGTIFEGIYKSDGYKFEYKIVDDPLVAKNEDGNFQLYLSLGEFLEGDRFDFKTMSSILNTFCSMIHPAYYDDRGNLIRNLDSYKDLEKNETKKHISYNYNWRFYEDEKNKKKVLEFYYKKPLAKGQDFIRVYTWLEHAQSVVKEVKLNSEYLFSQLNIPLIEVNKKGDHKITSTGINKDGSTQTTDFSNIIEKKGETFAFTFVKGVYDDTMFQKLNDYKNTGLTKITQVSADLNNMLHEGTVSIIGDPFFLFSDKMIPFSYLINLVVKKPTYINERGERVGGGKSYLSGNYMIKKISHSISAGEYTTNLEVMRALQNG